ncbi:5503_t:CDS:2 [Ambispora gerdemannii]|uniref:5503_t:CDS:1 n=1 Tax=Ambispora gerdemannii TaxID=144530 RepID=A0A9N9FWB6_9GLOM|nr:5503_t:CDS:2 [Ambispora gerdemannii]
MSEEMPEDTKKEATDAEKRRKRRQKKILRGAGDRLLQITTVHGGEAPFFTSPMPSQQSSPTSSEAPFNPVISSRKSSISSLSQPSIILNSSGSNNDQISSSIIHEEPESVSLSSSSSMAHIRRPDKEYLRQMLENMRKHNISTGSFTSTSGAGGDTSSLEEQRNIQQQQQLQSSLLLSGEETSTQSMFPFLSPEMMLLGSTLGIGVGGQNLRARTWKLIHFVVMFSLGLYVVSYKLFFRVNAWHHFNYLIYDNSNHLSNNELSIPLFWYFITLELILHTTRFFLDQQQLQQQQMNKPSYDSTNFVSILPYPLPQVITILIRYRLIWNNLWADLCALVFV